MAHTWKIKTVELKHGPGNGQAFEDEINEAIEKLSEEENIKNIINITSHYDDDRDKSVIMIFYELN